MLWKFLYHVVDVVVIRTFCEISLDGWFIIIICYQQLVKMVNGWRRKEFEKDRVLQTAVEEKNRLENDLIEQRAVSVVFF